MLRIFAAVFFLLLFFILPVNASAASRQYVNIVNPVRGSDFFQLKEENPLTNVKKTYATLRLNNLSSTWLLRPDALFAEEISSFFSVLPSNQEVGIFMEVTPTWANKAGVNYHSNPNWHAAGSVFLTGYEIEERKKLIDTSFEQFKKVFGNYPESVGAWWVDAFSLSYIKEKYGITASMDVADQYTTDNYQVWGQYFSQPFYPSKRNALIPASGETQKIGVVTIQWATRDPFNSYGNGVLDSTFSVQANDYANKKYHNLSIDYFKKLVSVYLDNPYADLAQVTVGLENDFSWEDFGEEYIKQLEHISSRKFSGTRAVTMSEFAQIYKRFYPDSPPQIIFAKDPLGSDGMVLWFQNTRYRMGWFYDGRGSLIRDLRTYSNSLDEPCFEKRCDNLNLAMTEVRNLDQVTYGDGWVIDEGKISDVKITRISDGVIINYVNQVGIKRKLEFVFNDVRVDSKSQPVSFAILEGIEAGKKTDKINFSFNHQLKDGLISVLITQLKNSGLFLLFSVFFFYLPGVAILKKANLSDNQKFILSWPVGLVLFTLISFTLGYLNFRWGVLILPILSLVYQKNPLLRLSFGLTKQKTVALVGILLGSSSWLLTSIKNGLLFDYGMGFWGAHGHDAIWHLSLIEGLKKGLPPENPIFSGTVLSNYHYFYDLLLAEVGRWTGVASVDLYFRNFPILVSLLVGILTFMVAKEWWRSQTAALLAVFFVYFGGSFGWMISYLENKSLGGETLFWAQQGISTLINPPLAISFLIFLAGLYLFQKIVAQGSQRISLIIPLIILWGSLIEFKAYGGILVLGSLAVVSLVEIIKRNFIFLKISIPVAGVSLLVFLPNNLEGASLLVLSPFWLIHSMVDFPDRLNFLRLTYARMAGIENKDWFKFFAAEAAGFLIFIVGNLGTRIIGAISIKKLFPLNSFNLFILGFLVLSITIPLLFIQKGANYNVIQFLYYFIFIFNFLAAFGVSRLMGKSGVTKVAAVVIIMGITLPTTWDTLHHFIPSRPPARVSLDEVEALKFLKEQPEGRVLSYYFDKKIRHRFTEPIPLLAYDSTAYVSALSGKNEYISDTVNLEILGVDYKGRLQAQKDVLSFREPTVVKKILEDNKIKYLYIPKIYNPTVDLGRFNLERIFENKEVEIFRVQ